MIGVPSGLNLNGSLEVVAITPAVNTAPDLVVTCMIPLASTMIEPLLAITSKSLPNALTNTTWPMLFLISNTASPDHSLDTSSDVSSSTLSTVILFLLKIVVLLLTFVVPVVTSTGSTTSI